MANSQYEIEIIISNDGQIKAKVDGLTKSFVGLTSALTRVKKAQQENNESLIGTNKYYQEQIAKAEQLRDRTAKTSEAYAQATREIDALRIAQQALTKQSLKVGEAAEGTLAAFQREISALREEQKQVAKNNTTWRDYENRINSVKDKMALLTDSTRMSAKPNQDLISSAGLAGATLTEFGRVVSDANYGIRGIANNLSQLSFLFITLISKTQTAAAAFKLLWRQLMGPLGLILAFQAVISVLEYFAINQDKAGKAAKDFEKEIASQTNALVRLNEAALAAAEGTAERAKALQALGSLNKEINQLIKNESLTYEELNDLIRTHIELKAAEARSNALANKLKEEGVENDLERIKIEQDLARINTRLAQETELYNKVKEEEGANAERIGSKTLEIGYEITILNRALARQTNELNELNKERNNLTQLYIESLDRQRTLEAEAVAKSPRTVAFWQNQINIIKQYQETVATTSDQYANAQKAIELYQAQIDAITGEEAAKKTSTIARELADELAVIDKDKFDAQRIVADQEFRDTIERIQKEKEEKILSAKEAEEARVLAAELRRQKIDQINEEEKQYDLDLTEKAIKGFQDSEDKFEKEKEKSSKATLDRIDKEVLKSTNASKKIALESITDKKLLQAEFNRIDQENIRTQIAVINAAVAAGSIGAEVGMDAIEKLNARLVSLGLASADSTKKPEDFDPQKAINAAKEVFNAGIEAAQAALDAELSIEEAKTAKLNNELRKRLDNENLSAEQRKQINDQIAKNEELLQIKRDKIAEKAFKLQKTLSIANTLISTYEMATKAYKALAGIPIVGPALGTAAATAATIFGLKQVDAISRQQFVPSAIGGRGDSGATSAIPIQAPDFNVVGQSQTSQLAAVVQGQLDKPIKTYVVASDVSTAQELERKKISTATI